MKMQLSTFCEIFRWIRWAILALGLVLAMAIGFILAGFIIPSARPRLAIAGNLVTMDWAGELREDLGRSRVYAFPKDIGCMFPLSDPAKRFARRSEVREADIIILGAGRCDVYWNVTPEAFEDGLRSWVAQIRHVNPDAALWLQTIPPVAHGGKPTFAYNVAIRAVAADFGANVLDLSGFAARELGPGDYENELQFKLGAIRRMKDWVKGEAGI